MDRCDNMGGDVRIGAQREMRFWEGGGLEGGGRESLCMRR